MQVFCIGKYKTHCKYQEKIAVRAKAPTVVSCRRTEECHSQMIAEPYVLCVTGMAALLVEAGQI